MNKFHTKAQLSSIDEKEHTIKVIMTAEVVDRHGEIVDVDTMDTKDFMLNPVVLQSHDYDEMSVGKVIDVTKTILEGGVKAMEATIKFAVEEYDVAKTYWGLYKGGYMSAFSIGFMVGSIEVDPVSKVTRLLNCKMLEISCVAVPANQLALAKAKGLNIDAVLKTIPEAELTEAVRKMIVDVQALLIVKTESDKATVDTNKTSAILEKEAKRERAKLLVSKAIRLLRQ